MRQLGEQWMEKLDDGKRHMLKMASIEKEKDGDCGGCCFYLRGGYCGYVALHTPYGSDMLLGNCPVGNTAEYIIKDLGILNDEGFLPSPWGEYPLVKREFEYADKGCNIETVTIGFEIGGKMIEFGTFTSVDDARTVWNRRM